MERRREALLGHRGEHSEAPARDPEHRAGDGCGRVQGGEGGPVPAHGQQKVTRGDVDRRSDSARLSGDQDLADGDSLRRRPVANQAEGTFDGATGMGDESELRGAHPR
jgi:hypothetical protein